MKNIWINDPCSENWNEMNPTQKGAFCQKYANEVDDFIEFLFESNKNNCASVANLQLIFKKYS